MVTVVATVDEKQPPGVKAAFSQVLVANMVEHSRDNSNYNFTLNPK